MGIRASIRDATVEEGWMVLALAVTVARVDREQRLQLPQRARGREESMVGNCDVWC